MDVFIERLPGFPDGISRAPDGSFWLALVAPVRGPLPKLVVHKALRVLLAYMPKWATPPPPKCVRRLHPHRVPPAPVPLTTASCMGTSTTDC